MAWSALQFPWKYRPLNEEEMALATSHDMPPLLPGMDAEGMVEFFASLTCTLAYDYDPEKDYREFYVFRSSLPYIAILSLSRKCGHTIVLYVLPSC